MSGVRSGVVLGAALAFAGAPALAEIVGIAFAQAVEQSVGHCVGGSATATLDCARERCVAGGALPGDCLRQAWCYPAGWSADIFVQHREGIHWHQFLCGWSSREALDAAVDVACDDPEGFWITCEVVARFDPDGTEIPAE